MRLPNFYIGKAILTRAGLVLCGWFISITLLAQSTEKKYSIKDGKMWIELSRQLNELQLDSFISAYELFDLDLKNFFKTNSPDSLQKLGWKLEKNSHDFLVISKPLAGFDHFDNAADKILFTNKKPSVNELFPEVNNEVRYGYNNFRKKSPFLVTDSLVSFFLRNNSKAKKVMLAGSFNEWNPEALSMKPCDSGWIAIVKLAPGKYWYKFIVDGNWRVDTDNSKVENDGRGNNNSVYYKPNQVFRLNGFEQAKTVIVAGSFNNWRPKELQLIKTTGGWELPLYLNEGTHTYRFVVDGQWMTDPLNKNRLPNEFNDFNSVLQIGTSFLFSLRGFENAKQVILSGSFNNWKEYELFMIKTTAGWELPYTLGRGNHEYRYRVDGKWIDDPANPAPVNSKERQANSFLVIGANYTFRLKEFLQASSVFLVGDFNYWSPNTFAMKKQGEEWVLKVYLSSGKHLYKFVVDGKWIKDPANHIWEQNEHATGNSVIWFNQ